MGKIIRVSVIVILLAFLFFSSPGKQMLSNLKTQIEEVIDFSAISSFFDSVKDKTVEAIEQAQENLQEQNPESTEEAPNTI